MYKNTDRNSRIFRDELYLTPQYSPDRPLCRENELNKIRSTVKQVRKRSEFQSLLIYGPAGIGKTTCVEHTLEEFSQRPSLKQVKINCWQYNSRSALLTELLIQLGYPAPRKGKPVDELLSKLQEWLDKNRDTVIWLDEFDQLNDKTEIVYDFYMVSDQATNTLGLLMVSNKPPTDFDIDPRSESRLKQRTLKMEPYSQEELRKILQERVEKAFKNGSVPDESLNQVAKNVAEYSGDCRRAFDLLLRAGQRAEEENIREVTPRMVDLEWQESD